MSRKTEPSSNAPKKKGSCLECRGTGHVGMYWDRCNSCDGTGKTKAELETPSHKGVLRGEEN
jgi:RecJ-like exonuclease